MISSQLNTPIQHLSIQYLNIPRSKKFIKHSETTSIQLLELIKKIVTTYNEATQQSFILSKSSQKLGEFSIVWFQKTVEGKTKITQVVASKSTDSEEKLTTRHLTFIAFLYRDQPIQEIFALTTRDAWHIVRECVDYNFPARIAEGTVDSDKICRITRRNLIGKESTKEELTNPSSDILFSLHFLYYLIESYDAEILSKSPIYQLPALKEMRNLKIRIETGVVRFLKNLTLNQHAEIAKYFSEIYRSKKTLHPRLGFFRLLSPIISPIKKHELNQQLLKMLWEYHQQSKVDALVHVHHKYLDSYLYAKSYEFQPSKKRFRLLPPTSPTLSELITFIKKETPQAMQSEESFIQELSQSKIRYTTQSSEEISFDLLDGLECEIRDSEGLSYFKVREMWYQLSVDYHTLMDQTFRDLLQKILIDSSHEAQLPLPWTYSKENLKSDNKITAHWIKEKFGIIKGHQKLVDALKKPNFSFIKESVLNRKTDPILVTSNHLKGEILKVQLIAKRQTEIEKHLLSQKDFHKTTFKEIFGEDLDSILEELFKQRVTIDAKGEILTPLFDDFLITSACPQIKGRTEDLKKRLDEVYEAQQALSTISKTKIKREEIYNRGYLSVPNYILGDQICPSNIEPFDLLKFTDQTTYLFHVKETFGQHTRDVCSQILNAAKEFRSALSMHQTANYIQALWMQGTTAKDETGYRAQVKEQLIQMGEEKFKSLFLKRKIIFVYACVEERLSKESQIPSFITSDHLDCLETKEEQRKLYEKLQKENYLDSLGRLTNKFNQLKNEEFQLEGYSKKQCKTIYEHLKRFRSTLGSTLAKLEVLQLHERIQALGYELKICQIQKEKSEEIQESPLATQESPLATQESRFLTTSTEDSESCIEEESIQESGLTTQSYSGAHPISMKTLSSQGLMNLGNSCYMNAVLQILFHIPEFMQAIEKVKDLNPILKHILEIQNSRTKSYLKALRNELFAQKNLQGVKTVQQDAQELLCSILDLLPSFGINASREISASELGEDSYLIPSNIGINLPLYIFPEAKTLQEVVSNYFGSESKNSTKGLNISVKEKELTLKNWEENLVFHEAPELLILMLKRFSFDTQKKESTKLTQKLTFPTNNRVNIPINEVNQAYTIIGSINHVGTSAEFGHYTADFLNEEEQWMRYDDQEVEALEQRPQTIDKQGYIIFLRKTN